MLSTQAELLLTALHADARAKHAGHAPYIHVSDAISTAASLYEKARSFIDFRAEHLLRVTAIERILVRRAKFLGQRESLGNDITRELIRLRYLPNDQVPESMVGEVDAVLAKYVGAIDIIGGEFDARSKWLLSMCAVELEELFGPNHTEHALVQVFFEKVKNHIATPGVPDVTKDFQLYIAAYKSLTKSDPMMTEFHLLRVYVPQWFERSVTVDQSMVDTLIRAKDAMTEQLTHPLQKRLNAQLRKVVAPFSLLRDLMHEQGEAFASLLRNRHAFEEVIESLIARKEKQNAERLWRRGVRALIYVFITKIVVGMFVELPYDYFILKHIAYTPLAINLLFPPLLLFIILASIRRPGKANAVALQKAMVEVVYADEPALVFSGMKKINIRKKQGFGFWVYTTFYIALWMVTFGAIAGFLTKTLQFNAVSTGLFLLFISIISFFGVALRQTAQEMVIISGKESLPTAIFNALALPVLTLGRYISENVSRINIFLFIFDVLIEAPFQFIMEALESWFDFLREKKEEM